MPHFIDGNYDSPLDLVRSPARGRQLLRLGAFGRLGDAVRKRFRDPRLHRLFSFQAMYAGLAPDEALALYAVITYMDSVEGVYFPEGGMHAVPVALARPPRRPARRSATATRSSESCAPPPAGWPGCGLASGDADSGRRRGLHPRPAGGLPDAPARPASRRGRPGTRTLLAVGGGLARRRPRGARRPTSPTTTSTSATSGTRPSTALLKRGRADAATRRAW